MKAIKGDPLIRRFSVLAWIRVKHGRLGKGVREESKGKI
jgi:hypothetical protein